MKKKAILLFSLFPCLAANSQQILSTQGDSYSNSIAKIEFTIGELIINTGTNGTNDITQGYHQTNWNFLGVEDFGANYEAVIFPNPTEEILYIKTSEFENVIYSLYDAQGRLIMQNLLSAEQTPIQLTQLSAGSYSLTLKNEAQNLKQFNLVKIH